MIDYKIKKKKSPPALIISKGPDGTETYSGALAEVMNYIKSALNIRYTLMFHGVKMIKIPDSYLSFLNKSYEYVRVSDADLVKYGFGPSQFNQIINGV